MTELNIGTVPAKTALPRRRVPLIRMLIYVGIALVIALAVPVARFFLWAKCFDLHGFHFSTGSMCPAICEGEFFLAGMDAYIKRSPVRGDVILFDHSEDGTKWVKRVIGVGGDTIARGPANTILVNGTALALPPPCGEHNSYAPLGADGPPFETVQVPQGFVFVIGDDLDNSYDSREFGVVPLDKVRGKALLIYASSNASRIGCRIR